MPPGLPYKRRSAFDYVGRPRKSRARNLRTFRSKSRVSTYRRQNTGFVKRVQRAVNRFAEQKEHIREIADNLKIEHNVLQNINDNALYTVLGTIGEGMNTSSFGSRQGKKIYAKGLACSLILESQQYRPNVDYWLYLVRQKRTPDAVINIKTDMFEGISDQIPTDYIDSDKVQVIFCKKFKPRMPNPGIDDPMQSGTVLGSSDGNAHNATGGRSIPNPRLLTKFYVPLNRTIHYRDYHDDANAARIPLPGSRYQWCMVAYNNNSTIDSGGTWPCGHLWLTTKLKFTDV